MAGPVRPGSTQAREQCEPRARPFARPSIREDHQGLRPCCGASRPETRLQVPVPRQRTQKPLATRGRSIRAVLVQQQHGDQVYDGGLVGEDTHDLGAASTSPVEWILARCRRRHGLGRNGGGECRDDASATLARTGQRIAHEVHTPLRYFDSLGCEMQRVRPIASEPTNCLLSPGGSTRSSTVRAARMSNAARTCAAED
jgi:hypothetical protein